MFPKLLAFFFVVFAFLLLFLPKSYADELDDINKQISDLTVALNQSVAATKPLESQVQALTKQLEGIKSQMGAIEQDLVKKEENINSGYEHLEEKQTLLNQTVREYYIQSYYNSPFLTLLSFDSASDATKLMAYHRAQTNQDKSFITNLALSILSLETQSEELKKEKTRLDLARNNLDAQATKINEVVLGAKAYQKEVSTKLSELSARQQEIVNARSGGFTATIGDSDLADDYYASIKGFRESAPSGSFAVFSFGAHTHRKGMSQYGARGRAAQGQTTNQILKAYYGKEPVSKDTGGDIQVTGFGAMSFEDRYLLGIAEMPSSWHPEALKAQAIAARTYAYRYKAEGKAICTTEACQVYNDGKASNPPESWRQAVQATRGQVLEDVVTYYASTHGGYASPIGWDTTDGGGGGNFIDKAYDKLGGSPWLYKAWYTQGYSPSSDKCGRGNPWLNGEEMADIVNAALALRSGGVDTSRITPVTTSCWGGNPYSMSELRSIAPGSISNANSVAVTQGNGTTNSVTINGVTLSGDEFKKAFNLRAPGRLSIPQSGFAFFNVEKK